MPALSLRRKQKLPVIDHLQEKPGRNEHSVSLPPELWRYIIAFLDISHLARLYLLNHTFYDAFLSCKFSVVRLSIAWSHACNVKKELKLLRSMRNPIFQEKIRELYFDSEWETNLISALDVEDWKSYFPHRSWSRLALSVSGRMEKAKRKAIQNIHSTLSRLPNIARLSLVLQSSMSEYLLLDTLWTAYSQNLTSLTLRLDCHLHTPGHTFGLGISCPHLRSLDVVVLSSCPPYPELLNDVRSLVPEDGGCLEKLSIWLVGHKSALSHCDSFGSLRKLRLFGDRTALPSIVPFIAPHRDTLEEITLGPREDPMDLRDLTLLNASILTSLIVPIEPFLENQDEMYPFLSRCSCLRTLWITHKRPECNESSAVQTDSFAKLLPYLPSALAHLTFPGLHVALPLFMTIFWHLPNISSLTLSDCYLPHEEIRARFSHAASEQAGWPQLMKEPWLLVFENIPHAQLKSSIEEEK